MPSYNRGPCACCGAHECNPVSFEFVDLQIQYQYSQMGSTWYTNCYLRSAIIEVTHLDGVVEQLDVTTSIQYLASFASSSRHFDNQGFVTVCGKTAQWSVVFSDPGNVWEFTGTMNNLSSVNTSQFR